MMQRFDPDAAEITLYCANHWVWFNPATHFADRTDQICPVRAEIKAWETSMCELYWGRSQHSTDTLPDGRVEFKRYKAGDLPW